MKDTIHILLLFDQVIMGVPVFDELPPHKDTAEGDEESHTEHADELQGIQTLRTLDHIFQGAKGFQFFQKMVIDFMVLQCLFIDREESLMPFPAVSDAELMEYNMERSLRRRYQLYRTDEEDPRFRSEGISVENPLVFIHHRNPQVLLAEPVHPLLSIFPDQMEDFIGKTGIGPGRDHNQCFSRKDPLLPILSIPISYIYHITEE